MSTPDVPELLALDDLQSRRAASEGPYLEFIRRESLSCGLYELGTGEVDAQQPHTEDEVYFVISGRARFRAGENDLEVGPGSVLYVPRLLEHRFHDITEALSLLVFFAPAETET